jgi:cob(I)alamin adenosyltransferase
MYRRELEFGRRKAMSQKIIALSLAALGLTAAGCAKKSVTGNAQWGDGAMSTMVSLMPSAGASESFIAERHKLEVVTPEQNLQKSWEATIAFCKTVHCEVLTSTITTPTGGAVPSGAITMRVVPDDLQTLLAKIQTLGQIGTHTTEREDVTNQVIDTEAKLKNLTAFRDSLREMLKKPSATVQDLVAIQQQLADTQAELDSQTTQRKILANETEKIAVSISFRAAAAGAARGAFSQVRDAILDSGSVLADSLASLITFIVALIPWLILIVPGVWLLGKAWRRLRRNPKGQLPTSSVEPAQKA